MTKREAAKLKKIRKKYPGKTMVFCTGGFDVTHAGHVLFFEDAKKLGDVLVVGIGPDKIIRKEKGKDRPILNENIRLKMVGSLKPVDHAFILEDVPQKGETFFEPLYRIIEALSPDVYVANDDASGLAHRKAALKKMGISFVVLKRKCPPSFENISTSKIIEKIKKLPPRKK